MSSTRYQFLQLLEGFADFRQFIPFNGFYAFIIKGIR